MYIIEFTSNARRQLKKKLLKYGRPHSCRAQTAGGSALPDHKRQKVDGSDFYRFRIANWRVIYDIHDDKLAIFVLEMGHRKEVYR